MPTSSSTTRTKTRSRPRARFSSSIRAACFRPIKVIYERASKRVYAEGHAKMTDEHGDVIYGSRFELSDDFRDGFHRQRPGSDGRQDALHLAARRAFDRRHHGAAERRLYRLRTVQRPSRTAAILAGAGDQDHRKPGDPHDLLRERPASVLGLSGFLVPLFFVARRDRQQADRPSGAVDRVGQQPRRRLQHALFHQSGAELRPDPHSDLPVETGLAGRNRLAAADCRTASTTSARPGSTRSSPAHFPAILTARADIASADRSNRPATSFSTTCGSSAGTAHG